MTRGPMPAPRNHIFLPELNAWKFELTKGKHTLVDAGDFDSVKGYSWYAHETKAGTYARRDVYGDNGKYRVYMHRYLAEAPTDSQVDHANYDTLDNRKANLRIADKRRNMQNRKKPVRQGGSSSQYKGVSWDKKCKKWHAYIDVNSKRIHLGRFVDEDAAGRAYNEAANKWFGEFALLNEL